MSDSANNERQRIREQKKRKLQERLENGGGLNAADRESTTLSSWTVTPTGVAPVR